MKWILFVWIITSQGGTELEPLGWYDTEVECTVSKIQVGLTLDNFDQGGAVRRVHLLCVEGKVVG